MRPTLPYIQKKYEEFNRLVFCGRLPKIAMAISDARSYRGICESRIRRHPDGRTEHYDFKIKISDAFDLPENEIEDVIIHEMIHFFIAYHGLVDSSPHGYLFKSMMASINTAHRRNICISHHTVPGEAASGQVEETVVRKGKWHVVAVLSFRDGRKGFKVLPRVMQRIIQFYSHAVKVGEISRVELYLTNETLFDIYPVSVALKYHTIPQENLTKALKGAEILKIENNKVVQTGKSFS